MQTILSNRKKNIFSFLLLFILVFCMIPTTALAASHSPTDGCELSSVTVDLANIGVGDPNDTWLFDSNGSRTMAFPEDWESLYFRSISTVNKGTEGNEHDVNITYSYDNINFYQLNSQPIPVPQDNLGFSIMEAGTIVPRIDMTGKDTVYINFTLDGINEPVISMKLVRANVSTLQEFPVITDPNVPATGIIDLDFELFRREILCLNKDGVERQLKVDEDFSASSGSTVITLLPNFLKSLEDGDYIIRIQNAPIDPYDLNLTVALNSGSQGSNGNGAAGNGAAGTDDKGAGSPNTGDSSNMLLWASLVVLGIIISTGIILYRRRVSE